MNIQQKRAVKAALNALVAADLAMKEAAEFINEGVSDKETMRLLQAGSTAAYHAGLNLERIINGMGK